MKIFIASMAIVSAIERFSDFGARGKFGEAWEYGQKVFGVGRYAEEELEFLLFGYGVQQYGGYLYGSDNRRWGYYQKRYAHHKLVNGKRKPFGPLKFIREPFFTEMPSRTEGQAIMRDNFKAKMAEWKLLTDEEKEVYNKSGRKYHLHGVNLFLRQRLSSN